jgi:hypothetical protein
LIWKPGARSQNGSQRDTKLPDDKISDLDKLYLDVLSALGNILEAMGQEAASEENP